jgi:dTDP-4-amino-4,6-dideoxygalactose transaminase
MAEAVAGRSVSAPHPDHRWLTRVRNALDAWERSTASQPTTSVFGSGAVAAAEAAFTTHCAGRPTLLLPSATYALRVGLQVTGVQPGDEVLCAAVDWPSGMAAITSLGAVPVPVAMDPRTLTLDPAAAEKARTSRTRAVIACHLHGICADVPALRALLPGVSIIEDAAQAFGCRLDGQAAGTLGDVAVFSLGPGKHIDAGEGGVLVCAERSSYEAAVGIACHPLRQLVSGIHAEAGSFALRAHPMTAVLALHALAEWSPEITTATRGATLELLAARSGLRILGTATRHMSTSASVPVLLDSPDTGPLPGVWWSASGASVLPCVSSADYADAENLLNRTRLATIAAMPVGND